MLAMNKYMNTLWQRTEKKYGNKSFENKKPLHTLTEQVSW